MKKLILAMIVCVLIFSVCGCSSSVKIDEQDKAIARFGYDDKNIEMELSESDFKEIADILNGKELYSDSPSCSFDENIAIIIDDSHYCIANDTCGIIYLQENDKYLHLSDEENEKIRDILEGYGFTFPCV